MGKRGTPRASCDPCRRKKVKCDKDQRYAQGISLCSFCTVRGYDCIITDEARPIADTSDNDGTEIASASTLPAKRKRKNSDAQESSPINDPPGHSQGPSRPNQSSASGNDTGSGPEAFITPQPVTEPDMLNIKGLTRSVLDDAVSSHFRTTYWCNPAVHPRHFYPRYRRYLGNPDGVASSSTDYESFPSAEILILAVACVGVVQLSYVSNRFDLQARLFRRAEKLVSQACTKDITVALDVLEAILLTFDVPARNKAVEDATLSSIDAGYVHPMSHTKMIRLLLHHGLNRSKEDPVVKAKRLKHHTPDRRVLNETNYERMPLILAVAATNDIIRSFDLFDRHQLLQDDIDPDAMAADLGGPIGNQWAWQLSVMASVLRTNNFNICSPRSRRLGIPPSAVLEVLEQLERFEKQIPEALRWNTNAAESNGAGLRQVTIYDTMSEDMISILVRKAFLNLLFWSQYRCIHTLVRTNGLQRPAQGTRLEGSLYLRARQRLDSLLLTAFDRMSEICPQLASITVPPTFASINLLDYSSIAFRSSTKHGAHYMLEMAKLTFKAGLHELTADLLSKAGRGIYAFSTYQCHPDTQAEAAKLRKILSSLYTDFEMIPGLGATNEAKLRQERQSFSTVFEPAAADQDSIVTAALASDVGDLQWNSGTNGGSQSAPMNSTATWSTPGADELAAFGGSMNELLAGLPFVNGNVNVGPASTSPHPANFVPKTPASTTTTAASPFDLNAFLDTHVDSSATRWP
ncbi:uncharacterized protein MEPE_01686 [Melanopsichium pennsylvanicum]|uniref:Zn(2)-C6 fungal-type domain-containing protein n=2 Tax=Melanopsichium pennsylvanicum TaxID=63383 RepID=A0AAJ5C3U3_9BASI|nr:putative protein [Melanopsichium pennsylvanicum 4]SNX82980.1 uncharacterized protein MEPE_01686 [Melanopsichium pennsylvanicum]